MAIDLQTIITISIKTLKLVINFIILMLYRYGYGGEFLGVGGTWNLNEDKIPDVEIIASGVLVGFFIYTSVVMISFCFGSTKHKETMVEVIMNVVGTLMFIAVGALALHYWIGYQQEHKYMSVDTVKECGVAVGALCIVLAAIYLLDTVLAIIHLINGE